LFDEAALLAAASFGEGVVFDVDAVADGDADVVALDAVLLGEAVFDAPA
jgi:hypothetical protein